MDKEVGLKCQNPQRPYVHSLCILLFLVEQQLRRPINNRTCHFVCSLFLGRSPKICNLESTLGINYILRFDISVYDPLLMNNHQSMCNIHQHLKVLILNQMVHFNFVSQRIFSQLKQNINIIVHDPKYQIIYFYPKQFIMYFSPLKSFCIFISESTLSLSSELFL